MAETFRFRIWRFWHQGARQGHKEIFLDNLPGFPDGVGSTDRGIYWIALCSLRDPTGSRMAAVTSVEEFQGVLYLASLDRHVIGRLSLPRTRVVSWEAAQPDP